MTLEQLKLKTLNDNPYVSILTSLMPQNVVFMVEIDVFTNIYL